MKPTAIFKGMITDMRGHGQTIDYLLAERNTQAALREQYVEDEQACGLIGCLHPDNAEITVFFGLPTTEEKCPYAGLGTECDPVCVYCDMKHVCMYCTLKPRSAEASNDRPCPLRIPGCRCPTGAGPSILEYYCNADDPFMGASYWGAGHGGLMEDDELLGGSGYENLFKGFGSEEPLEIVDSEHEGEEIFEDKAPNLYSPQSLWPLSNGLVPGWEQGLPPHPEPSVHPQFDCNDYLGFMSKPPTFGPQHSVAAGQHGRGGGVHSSKDVLQLPTAHHSCPQFLLEPPKLHNQNHTTGSQRTFAEAIPTSSIYVENSMAYNGYSPFLPRSLGLTNQGVEAASQDTPAGKAPSSTKPVTGVSRPRATHDQGAGHKRAAMERARSSEQLATKKDSRRWEEHEKAFVRTLMEEVISEGTQTEERWKVISKQLSSRYSINRTWTAVKNYWNRHGRSDTNIDERKIKKPDRMITGVQDPESRRKARQLKRKDAEGDDGNDLVDLDYFHDDDDDDDEGNDDSDSESPSKRQRR